jgi:hypothetical protein
MRNLSSEVSSDGSILNSILFPIDLKLLTEYLNSTIYHLR